jgi:endonuclease YncB( thermonuclease family)
MTLCLCLGTVFAEGARVQRVLSVDRVLLTDGRRVRYIGVGAPTMAVAGKSATQAQRMGRDFNRKLVQGREIRLVFDRRRTDRRGNLLAYVYQGNLFVNAEIVRKGYALVHTDPENKRYTEYFKKLLREAVEEEVGLWQTEKPFDKITPPPPVPQAGKIVFVQPNDRFYYSRGHERLGPRSRPLMIEDALKKGYQPYSTERGNETFPPLPPRLPPVPPVPTKTAE